jgi:hypothetical protein
MTTTKLRPPGALRGSAGGGAAAVAAFAVVVVLVASAVRRASVEAIPIEYGRWAGDVSVDGRPVGVHFDVFRLAGRPRIRLLGSPAHGLRVVEIVSVTATADGITFVWPGPVRRLDRRCALSPQPDGVFTGDCVLPGELAYDVRMIPPSAGHHPTGLAHRLLVDTAAWRNTRHGPIRLHVHRASASTVDADALGRAAAEHLTEALALLGETSFDGPLHVFAVPDRAAARELAGGDTALVTDPMAGAIVVQGDTPHAKELRRGVVDILAPQLWGVPAPPARWLQEGLAVLARGSCRGHELDDVVRYLRESGRLPAFAELLVNERTGERGRESLVIALTAASLVDHIRRERGIGAVRRIWQRGVHAGLAELDAGTPQLLEAAWLARLAAQSSPLGEDDWATIADHGCR